MKSRRPEASAGDGSTGANDSETDESIHQPYRTWALQQDLSMLLAPDPAWRLTSARPRERSGDAHSHGIRGQAYLREQLAPRPNYALRTTTSICLWLAVLLTDAANQWGPTGIKMETRLFWPMIAGVLIAVSLTYVVYPRIADRRFQVVEQIMLAVAVGLAMFQISATGGADSPYSVWLLFTAFYAAYFMPRGQAICNTALMVAAAVAPVFYEPSETGATATLYACLLAGVIVMMSAAVFYRRNISRAAKRGVTLLALSDPLTRTANLRAFEQFGERVIVDCDGKCAVVMVDMNGLRAANIVFGYEVGDGMVVRLAELMLRVSDESAQVARIGGDEFAVLIPGGGKQEASDWQSAFEAEVDAHNASIRGRLPRVSVAIGAATSPKDGLTVDDLVEVADHRMYAHKTPAVPPPHTLDAAQPSAPRFLAARDDSAQRVDRAKESSLQGGTMWLVAGAALLLWAALPGATVSHEPSTVLLGLACLLISGIGFAGRVSRFERFSSRLVADMGLVLAAPAMWITGGWESPFQVLGVLAVAYYSQFYRGREAIARCAILMGAYSVAFWTSGTVSPAGQTTFATIITAEITIAAVLQVNARATDRSFAAIRDLASRDGLTGVGNLHAFRVDLANAVAGSDRDAARGAPILVLANLDNFRAVNTAAGHRGGDAILREAARRLGVAGNCGGSIYRVAGDEFAVLCGADCLVDPQEMADECRTALSFDRVDDVELRRPITATVGCAVLAKGMTGETFVSAVQAELAEGKKRWMLHHHDAGDQILL
jgi:diguanylate cyclase (GGDEF)-like protein